MKCEPGDVVRLKSGGPKMTVGDEQVTTVYWLDESQAFKSEEIPDVMLKNGLPKDSVPPHWVTVDISPGDVVMLKSGGPSMTVAMPDDVVVAGSSLVYWFGLEQQLRTLHIRDFMLYVPSVQEPHRSIYS